MERLIERNITIDSIQNVIDHPDKIVKEDKRKILYEKKLEDGRILDAIIRGNSMLVTAYWRNENK
jgi:hypothetical protein